MKSKKYLLYAIGEIFLIVVGILLALYINNRNTHQQYKNQIDNNIIRVYGELENNIERTRDIIEALRNKDSLINLVMNDSLTTDDYLENLDLAYLIVESSGYTLNDKAFQNLIQLNISDNRYNDELLINLKELYATKEWIDEINKRMATFVLEVTRPFLLKNINSYGDLTYHRSIKEDALDFYMTSATYKSYVSQYAILAIKNQLTRCQRFYKDAIDVYNQISKRYDLKNKNTDRLRQLRTSDYQGRYLNELNKKDTLEIKIEHDSLFMERENDFKMNLISIKDNRFFMDNGDYKYFVSFSKSNDNKSDWNMRTHFLTHNTRYRKLKNN